MCLVFDRDYLKSERELEEFYMDDEDEMISVDSEEPNRYRKAGKDN